MKQRMLYIDELKGFAVFLVVMGHLFMFSFHDETSVMANLIYSFHMPLFAFVSGLLIKRIISFCELLKRVERLIYPMLVLGFLYVWWRGIKIQDYLFNDFKYGYWYLLFLFISYIIITITDFLNTIVNRNNNMIKDILIVFVCYLLIVRGGNMPIKISCFLGWNHVVAYIPYIFAGHIINKYSLQEKIFSCSLLYNSAFILTVITFIVRQYLHHGTALYLLSPCAVVAVVSFFYRYKDNNNQLKKILQNLGKQSLEVYTLHYFFIHSCYINFVSKDTISQVVFIEIVIVVLLASLISLSCMYIGKLIKTNSWLGYICFGIRK